MSTYRAVMLTKKGGPETLQEVELPVVPVVESLPVARPPPQLPQQVVSMRPQRAVAQAQRRQALEPAARTVARPQSALLLRRRQGAERS